jgi:hypothetical protein
MSHLLIIKDQAGKELARVPVSGGYTIQEVPLPKEKQKSDTPVTSVDIGDSGKGRSKVGSN